MPITEHNVEHTFSEKSRGTRCINASDKSGCFASRAPSVRLVGASLWRRFGTLVHERLRDLSTPALYCPDLPCYRNSSAHNAPCTLPATSPLSGQNEGEGSGELLAVLPTEYPPLLTDEGKSVIGQRI